MITITKPEAINALTKLREHFEQQPNEELKRLVNELLVYVNRTIPYSLK